MQYNRRRQEEHGAPHRFKSGPDPFLRNRRDGSDPVQQRNISPVKIDGVRRGGGRNTGDSDGFEGRNYDRQHVGSGRRSARVRSRSPPAEPVWKRSHFDDEIDHISCSSPPPGLRARFEMSKTFDAKRVYLDREKNLIGSKLGGEQVDQNLLNHGENEVGGYYRYRSTPDMGASVGIRNQEAGGHRHLPPRDIPMGQFEHGRLQRGDHPPPIDKMPPTESHSHGGAEKNILHAGHVSISSVSPSYAKDFAGTSNIRGYGGSSIRMSRGDFLCSHVDEIYLPHDLSRNRGKLAERPGYSGNGQRTGTDTVRDAGIGTRNMTCHQQCAFSPTRADHGDYLNFKLQVRETHDEHLYNYDDLPRRIAPHDRLNYKHVVTDYDNREFSRPNIPHPDLDRTVKIKDSYGNQRRVIVHDYATLQRSKYFDYHDVRRTSIASMQEEAYLRSGYNHIENGKRMPQVSHVGSPQSDRLPILRTEYESVRDGGRVLQQERFQNSPLSKHNLETYKAQEMRQYVSIHDHPDRLLKRKYNANDEIDVHDLTTITSSKWGATEEFQDVYESEEWIDDEDMDMFEFNPRIYRKYKKEYDELENKEDFPSDEWILPQISMGHVQRHSFQSWKYSNQNIKHHSKSQHSFNRNAIQKKPKVWKKYHEYDENKPATNDESSEDWISAVESEPTEGSEEFNQMVHENFLMYSKKLNLNLYLQRRYQGHGKAGSLYCIVCGRSSSKEFMDTQRLVTHAFMSHKPGLRAKHLGLHKAICVLMGWDTVVAQDTVTWVPQVLPHAEALAQKEDLILWPPIIIIHNISMDDDNPQNWKVVSMETIEAFLRGKGFVRGRIKLCLGKPADQSIVLVKFLGTFGGLGDAERLHKYLSDNSRGRAEYERVKSKSIKSCTIGETEDGDKFEKILYGYMGIADDLDKLDFNSKKWSMVKSRKEIDDLDKAPVKADWKG
ncbi:hypothetical protein Fmac_023952 [Flemingia macrophylla]|uniref:XS domain-containing protein n=1 Tax=Flemingia macrophylla TaxID=520843 RepID=A0ABD1LN12_9FABA